MDLWRELQILSSNPKPSIGTLTRRNMDSRVGVVEIVLPLWGYCADILAQSFLEQLMHTFLKKLTVSWEGLSNLVHRCIKYYVVAIVLRSESYPNTVTARQSCNLIVFCKRTGKCSSWKEEPNWLFQSFTWKETFSQQFVKLSSLCSVCSLFTFYWFSRTSNSTSTMFLISLFHYW